MSDINFSIVIPTLNEEDNIVRLLEGLAKQTYRQFEVIINDSGSKDATVPVIRSFQDKLPALTLLEHPTRNVSGARNNGAAASQNEWLVFFDADVVPEPVFLEQMTDHINKHGLDMCTAWNRPLEKTLKGSLALGMVNWGMTFMQGFKPAANGPCILMKKTLFEKIGHFDESIVFGEDFEIIQRAWKTSRKFKVFQTPLLYVSTRRFDKEGLVTSVFKSGRALIYQLFIGPIRKPIFEYEMGGQYYKNKHEGKN